MSMARGGAKFMGAWLLAAAAVLGLLLSIYLYLTPSTGVAGTPGAILVIVSTALLLLAALLFIWDGMPRWLNVIFIILAALDLLGTALAGWMLNSQILAGLMVIGAIGWLVYVFGKRRIP
jgi:hypothetical protein